MSRIATNSEKALKNKINPIAGDILKSHRSLYIGAFGKKFKILWQA